MDSLQFDGKVHHPLGAGSYVFKQNYVEYIANAQGNGNIRLSVAAQPNSSPHFGTLAVFCLAFSLASRLKASNPQINPEILLELIDTAPSTTEIIDDIEYQKSLRYTHKSDHFLPEYQKLMERLSKLSTVSFNYRTQDQFNKSKHLSKVIELILNNKETVINYTDFTNKKLRIRVPCPNCGLTDKKSVNTQFEDGKINSFCPEHGWFEIPITDSEKLEYNTPIRNIVRGMLYSEENQDSELDYKWMRVTGSDYCGFYQEDVLYKCCSELGYPSHLLPMIVYTPLISDWSGAKLSKSLYVKEGAYKYLPQHLVNFESFLTKYGESGIDRLYEEVLDWVDNPYKLFRGYSVYYFLNNVFND